MDIDTNHDERIKKELTAAGMTSYGFLKPEVKRLAELIHENEHIGGVVYGRYENGSGVLVATNNRVLFLDYKPLVKTADELSYDVVSGVSISRQGFHAKVTLHTRLGDYSLRFVNLHCASRFVKFIESKRLEQQTVRAIAVPPRQDANSGQPRELSQEAKIFLASHDTATFSSIDELGNVHGATVYYTFDAQDHIYITTQTATTKAHDVSVYPQVAITISDTESMRTLQISGLAKFETDTKISEKVYKQIIHPRLKGKNIIMPPLLYMKKGNYIIIRITPINYAYHVYK